MRLKFDANPKDRLQLSEGKYAYGQEEFEVDADLGQVMLDEPSIPVTPVPATTTTPGKESHGRTR